MKKTRSREQRQEGHDSSDRWLLTYADLITLLLGLFVILYTMSKVDNSKYAKVVQAFGGMFGKPAVLDGTQSVLPVKPVVSEAQSIEDRVRGTLYEDVQSQLITVSHDDRGIVVHLAEELLFGSGSAMLKNSSSGSMDLLAGVLKTLPNEIRIEGHTDDVPINTVAFPSNWQLSVARAMNTAEYLMKRHGMTPEKVTIVGYSQYRPLVPNTSVENRAKNRRVDIVIVATGASNQIP